MELRQLKKDYSELNEKVKKLDQELKKLYEIESDLVKKMEKEELKYQVNKQKKMKF